MIATTRNTRGRRTGGWLVFGLTALLAACGDGLAAPDAGAGPGEDASCTPEAPAADAAPEVEECPLSCGCPEGCMEIVGRRHDEEAGCLRESAVITCGEASIVNPAVSCYVDGDGTVYITSSAYGLVDPAYPGWRECTPAEQRAAESAGACE